MKHLMFFRLALINVWLLSVLFAHAQTPGQMELSVRTVSYGGNYANKGYYLAAWVMDNNGAFVETLQRPTRRPQHLVAWQADTEAQYGVDAVTAATVSPHTTHTFTWNCTDTSGNTVPDGTYRIRVEYTEDNSDGSGTDGPVFPTTHVAFVKGASAVSGQISADLTYFKDITLDYTPTAVPHNIRCESITAPAVAQPGSVVVVDVLVSNLTSSAESNVSVVLSNVTTGAAIQTKTITSLGGNASSLQTFSWNTTGLADDTYTLAATAGPVPDETDTTDNAKQTSVEVRVPAHDVSVSLYAPAQAVIGTTFGAELDVFNPGEVAETFDVQLLDGRTNAVLQTWSLAAFPAAGHTSLGYRWNTSGLVPATYRLQAVAQSVGTETNAANNYSTAFVDLVEDPMALWRYRCRIQASGYSKGTQLESFPMLVKLDSSISGFAYSQFNSPVGNDLRFTDDGGTTLFDYEIESWDTGGTSVVWVRVPTLRGTNTAVWAHWGNAAAAANPPAYATNGATWGNGYVGVWHMTEDGVDIVDSTGNGFTGTRDGTPERTDGVASYGQYLNEEMFNLGDLGICDGTRSNITVELWVKDDGTSESWGKVISKHNGSDYLFALSRANSDTWRFVVDKGTTRAPLGAYTDNEWYYLSMSWDGVTQQLMQNGSYIDFAQVGALDSDTSDVTVASRGAAGSQSMHGSFDEIRISSVTRSSNWVWACWSNQKPDSTFCDYGAVIGNPALIDIAVTRVHVPGTALKGDPVRVKVTVANEGNTTESFDIALTDGGTPLATEAVADLHPHTAHTWTHEWDTRSAGLGAHVIAATVAPRFGETDASDNSDSATCMLSSDGIGDHGHSVAGSIGGHSACVSISGGHAYVGEGSSLTVVDISAPATPAVVGRIHLVGAAEDVVVSGSHAFVASGRSGVHVVEISAPTLPQYRTTVNTPGHAYCVAVEGSHLYVADGPGGLRIIDISAPATPSVAAVYSTEGPAHAVVLSGATAFVADHHQGLVSINVTTPSSPEAYGSLALPAFGQALSLNGATLYLGDADGGVSIVNVADPANMTLSGDLRLTGPVGGVAVSGTHLFAVAGNSGLEVIDVSAPSAPTNVASLATSGTASDVALSGGHAVVADGLAGLSVINVSAPTSPSGVAAMNAVTRARGSAIVGGIAYVAAGSDGVRIFNVANPAMPAAEGSMLEGTNACAVAAVSNLLHVAAGQYGLVLADIATPAAPSYLGRYTESGFGAARAVAAIENRAVITDGNLVKLINTASPASPGLLDTYDAPGYIYAMAWLGNHLYLAAGNAGVITLDMSSPNAFSGAHQLAVSGLCVDVEAAAGYAHVAASTGQHTLDLTEPGAPTVASSDTSNGAIRALAVANDLLHISEANPDVLTHSVTNPLTPVATANFGAILTGLDIAASGTRAIVAEGGDGFAVLNITGTDSDDDGLDDDVEQSIIDADPNDAIRTRADVSPDGDFDGDGLSNYAEEVAGTSAADVDSVLAFASTSIGAGSQHVLQWHSVAGRSYAIHSATDLSVGFSLLQGGIAADPPMNSYTTPTVSANTFYMVVVEP